MKSKFKTFTPRVDIKRRLVMTRFYAGVNKSNSFCYMIHRITKKGKIDKRYKFLYCFGTDDYSKIKDFFNANTGELTRTYKSSFKGVFKIKNKFDVLTIWETSGGV
jgi:hypothetical protein